LGYDRGSSQANADFASSVKSRVKIIGIVIDMLTNLLKGLSNAGGKDVLFIY